MPIALHSKESKEYIIFSVFQNTLTRSTNLANTAKIFSIFQRLKIQYKIVNGVYKDNWEVSILVEYKHLSLVNCIVKRYNQECILKLGKSIAHGLRKASLVYPDNLGIAIGYFRSRPEAIAKRENSYTYDPLTGIYYVVEQDYTQATMIRS